MVDEPYDAYLSRMSNLGTSCGDLELNLLSSYVKKQIDVYDEEKYHSTGKLSFDSYGSNGDGSEWAMSVHERRYFNALTCLHTKKRQSGRKHPDRSSLSDDICWESESGDETDSSDCIDNRKRKRNQNFNEYIGTVKHRDDMAHVGIDFVLYEVILSVSNMVGTVSKSGGEIPRLESQIKDRILPTVPKKRKRTGKRLRVQRPLVERGISNIRKLGR